MIRGAPETGTGPFSGWSTLYHGGFAMEKKGTAITLVLVFLAALLTLINLVFINGQRDRLEEMRHSVDNLRSEIRSEMNEVTGIFLALKEQAAWWGPGESEVIAMGPERTTARVSWFLKDYRAGSKVFFNYRLQGEEEYTALEAEEGTGGYFHALLEVEYRPEPQWSQQLTRSIRHGSDSPPEEIENAWPVQDGQPEVEYYISTFDGDTIRTGEPGSLPLMKGGYYSSLQSYIHVQDTRIEVVLHEELYGEPRHTVTGARVELLRGDGVVRGVSLVRGDRSSDTVEWHADFNAEVGKDHDTLRLVVAFSDGHSFSR